MQRLLDLTNLDSPSPVIQTPLQVPVVAARLTSLAVVFCIFSEFVVNLAAYPNWLETVRITNVVLLTSFVAVLVLRALQNRRHLRHWAASEIVNIAIGGAALLLLFTVPRAGVLVITIRVVLSIMDWGLSTQIGRRALEFKELRPSQSLALSFLALIVAGSALLLFPAATVDGKGASLTDAVFTISSATSVTGLGVVDTGSYFSIFGQVVILSVIQIGAIGIMVFAASFAVLVGGRLPGHEAATLEEAGFGELLDVTTIEGMRRLIYSVTLATLVIEMLGSFSMVLCWATGAVELRPEYDNLPAAIWWSTFHSISAFCHAGFSLESTSMMHWVSNPALCGIFVTLMSFGGVGFPVLADLYPILRKKGLTMRGRWRRLHIQTRVVLLATVLLYLSGMLAFLFFEYNGVLAGLSVPAKLNAALFQSASLRSAGFNSVDLTTLTYPSVIVCSLLMFIGTAPASTGGGVRITTVTVVLLAVRAMMRNRDDVELMGRRLPKEIVYRSISIVLCAALVIIGFLILLGATQQGITMDKLIFEVFSAFGTTGLTMGATEQLDTVGKWLFSVLMYFGCVGPITLALAVGEKVGKRGHTYPSGRIAVG